MIGLSGASNTFNWKDLITLFAQLGYENKEMAGSRVRLYKQSTKHMIRLHKPHPENHIKGGALKDVRQQLKQEGYL